MNWDEFLKRLVQHLFKVEHSEHIKESVKRLVRRHDKNLSLSGDFSCPGDAKIWSQCLKHDVPTVNLENLPKEVKSIKVSKSGCLTFWLDRKIFMETFFQDFSTLLNPDLTMEVKYDEVNCKVINECLNNADKSPMTNIRCHQVSKFAQRLIIQNGRHFSNHPPTTLVVSTRDHQDVQAVKVGPVIDKRTKKKSTVAFLNVYRNFFDVFDEASKERVVQSESKRLANVHAVVSAEIQFQLLNHNLGQTAILDEHGDKLSTFVLYNHARIVKLLHQSSSSDHDNHQPDVTLLNQEDEWEMIFVYLSKYLSMLDDELISENDIKVGRLCQFTFGLANVFSRYYNRVHVLKKAEHLRPIVHSRLYLIRMVKQVMEHSLHLLDIPVLGQM
jgi:hypothetical protein